MTLGTLAVLTLKAWDSSPALQERHPGDLTDYHQRILRQAMDCDLDEGEIPALISDVLSPEQIADAFTLAGCADARCLITKGYRRSGSLPQN